MRKLSLLACVVLAMAATAARADLSLLLVAADADPSAPFVATGHWASVAYFDSRTGTPTLPQLQAYDRVLAFTNYVPQDAVGLGNVLAQYAALPGKGVGVATYGYSSPWWIQGNIQNLTPFVYAGGTGQDPSGQVRRISPPGHPVWNTPFVINPAAITYFHNANFPSGLTLRAGATLHADDNVNTMLTATLGSVASLNFFPGVGVGGNNAELYKFITNVLHVVPEPATLGLLALGALVLRRR